MVCLDIYNQFNLSKVKQLPFYLLFSSIQEKVGTELKDIELHKTNIFCVIQYLLILSESFLELMKTANEREAALLISTSFAYLNCIQFTEGLSYRALS